MAEGGLKSIIAALGANLGIAVSKFVAYLFTGSSSMLAEAVHSFADSSNQVLLLIGGRRAKRPPTAEHPFGYGRSRYVYAFLVAVVIFLAGGVFALFEAYEKFHSPTPVEDPAWAFGVLVVAIGLEGFSLRTALREAKPRRRGLSLPDFIRRTKTPEFAVVILEDFGALCGLVLALVGVSVAVLTGDGRWDGVGSAAIGVLLVAIAVVLATQVASLLVGEAADPTMENAVRAAIGDELIHLRTLHLGPDELLVAAKIAVPAERAAGDVVDAIHATEEKIRAAVPYDCTIYLEPDLRRTPSF
ncbi:cation diffusion facilitator family transporter [Virgisporangium aliadipatigenens]|uniref:cation diffusion facilitator family transporter n=1 Tax=Virgisporangium aliadipatigenens TaxID=741659 RepID=UPI0027E59F14|nr:cation diffusion facilitator family transporter [Virgisporangium aliadipatigenens]